MIIFLRASNDFADSILILSIPDLSYTCPLSSTLDFSNTAAGVFFSLVEVLTFLWFTASLLCILFRFAILFIFINIPPTIYIGISGNK